jgi:hypothetical protein
MQKISTHIIAHCTKTPVYFSPFFFFFSKVNEYITLPKRNEVNGITLEAASCCGVAAMTSTLILKTAGNLAENKKP